MLEVIGDLLEDPNCRYGKFAHGTESHGNWKDVTWTIPRFGGSMLNFLTQVGFMNEWDNRWDHMWAI